MLHHHQKPSPLSNRNLIYVRQKNDSTKLSGSRISNQSHRGSSTGLRLSEPIGCERQPIYDQYSFELFNQAQLQTLSNEQDLKNFLPEQPCILQDSCKNYPNSASTLQQQIQSSSNGFEQPVIAIRPKQILSINTASEGLSRIASNNQIVSQSVKYIPRGGKLAESSRPTMTPINQVQRKPQQSNCSNNQQNKHSSGQNSNKQTESMVISEPDAEADIDLITAKLLKQSKHSEDYETMLSQRQVNSLLQQSEVQMREELSVRNVRPLNHKPKIQYLIKQALQQNHRLPMTGNRQSRSGKRRPQTRETLSSGSGSIVYPKNGEAMLIGNYSNNDQGAFKDSCISSAYSSLQSQQVANPINRNFIFTGRNVPKERVKSFQTLTFSANQPTATPSQSQFSVKRGRNLIHKQMSQQRQYQYLEGSNHSTERSNSTQSRKQKRRQFVKVSGRKIDPCQIEYSGNSRPSLTQGGKRLCHCSGVVHSTSSKSLRLKKQVSSDSKDQSYFQKLINQTSNAEQDSITDLDLSKQSESATLNGQFEYGLSAQISSNFNQRNEVNQPQNYGQEDHDRSNQPLNNSQNMQQLNSTVFEDTRNSMQSDGTILGPNQSPPVQQLIQFMQLRDATQLSTSNQSASLENSMKLAPKLIQTDEKKKKASSKNTNQQQQQQPQQKTASSTKSYEVGVGQDNKSSARSVKLDDNSKNQIKQQMPIGGIAIFHTVDGFNPSQSTTNQDNAIDMLNRSLLKSLGEQSHPNSKRDKPNSRKSIESSTHNVDGSILKVATKFAKELNLKDMGQVDQQAQWLAQASLSIAIVKKQLKRDDQNMPVSDEARNQYLKYLKQIIKDAEAEL